MAVRILSGTVSLYYILALICAVFGGVMLFAPAAALCARIPGDGGTFVRTAVSAIRRTDRAAGALPLIAILALLLLSLLAEVDIVGRLLTHIPDAGGLQHTLPVRFLPWTAYLTVFKSPGMSVLRDAFTGAMLVRALALRALWLRLQHSLSALDVAAAGLFAILLYATAFTAHGMVSADLYGYIAYARLGLHAYSAAPAALWASGAFAPLAGVAQTAWAGLNPAPYGPLWLALTAALFGHTATLGQAVLLERGLGLVSLLVLGEAIRRHFRSRALAMLTLLNPTLIYYFVIEGHNDIVPVALVAIALSLARSLPLAALCAVTAAGLIKAPYALIGLLAFAPLSKTPQRVLYAAGSLILTAALSWHFGGMGYLHGILFHVDHNGHGGKAAGTLVHLALAALALAAIPAALLARRAAGALSFAFPALAAMVYPWYLAMGLPYAMLERRILPVYLILLPVAALAMQPLLSGKLIGTLAVLAVTVCALLTSGCTAQAAAGAEKSFPIPE